MIQSVLFDKNKFTKNEAIKKLQDRGFEFKKIDETENFYRFRQHDPKQGAKYRTIGAGVGVRYIYEIK